MHPDAMRAVRSLHPRVKSFGSERSRPNEGISYGIPYERDTTSSVASHERSHVWQTSRARTVSDEEVRTADDLLAQLENGVAD